MVKSTKKYMQSLFFSGVLLVTSACSDVFCRRILESAFSNHLLADRIGCIDGFDSLL